MIKNVIIVILLGIIPFSYYWGSLCGKQEAEQSFEKMKYEQNLVSLSNEILYLDGISSNKTDGLDSVIKSSMETHFSNMVTLFMQQGYKELEYMRCAVTRKIREMKESKVVFIDEQKALDDGYPIKLINNYLENNCTGKPSHKNWSKK